MFIIIDNVSKISYRLETKEQVEEWIGNLSMRLEDIIKRYTIYEAERVEYTLWTTVKCKIDNRKG